MDEPINWLKDGWIPSYGSTLGQINKMKMQRERPEKKWVRELHLKKIGYFLTDFEINGLFSNRFYKCLTNCLPFHHQAIISWMNFMLNHWFSHFTETRTDWLIDTASYRNARMPSRPTMLPRVLIVLIFINFHWFLSIFISLIWMGRF